jgi:hypothetical protein
MSYYILFNPSNRDAEISKEWGGFVESYDDYDEAVRIAKESLDGEDYRDFIILEEDYRKIINN